MQIGYVLLISFIISMVLVLRLKDKVSRIFSVAAICCSFLVMSIVAVLPSTEVTNSRTVFIASVSLAGIVFITIVLINIFFKNVTRKSPSNIKESK